MLMISLKLTQIKSFLTLLLLGLALFSRAQESGHWTIETSFAAGKIIRHSPHILFDIPPQTTGVMLNFQHQTSGKKNWHLHQKFPRLGLAAGFFHVGSSQLGNIWTFSPNFSIDIIRKKNSSLQFQLHAGLSWVEKPFNRLERPTSNATGAKLNNFTGLQFAYLKRITARLDAALGFQMVHFSNGASRLPNFGYNIPMLYAGVRYFSKDRFSVPPELMEDHHTFYPHWRWQLFSYLGWREVAAIGGAKYPVTGISIGSVFQTTPANRFIAGVEFEHQQAVQELGLHMETFENLKEARLAALRLMIFGGHEFIFGPWSLTLTAGTYLGNFSRLIPFPIYSRLGMRYHLHTLLPNTPDFHVGLYLKAHRVAAEYFAFGLGCTL